MAAPASAHSGAAPQAPFTGVGVALVTLFDDDHDVDVAATADHAARLVDAGVRAVVVAGSTGEAASLDGDERVALLEAVRAAVDVPVLAGTGAASAREAVRLSAAAAQAGVDGLLVLSPPRSVDVRPYYEDVAAAVGGCPVLAYHFPAVSPPGIPVELLATLPVVGTKDSTGDPNRLLEELSSYDGATYVGSSALLLQAGLLGAAGAILALANAEPEDCVAAFAGDASAQLRLAEAHLRSGRRPPRGLKELVADRYGTSTTARMG